MWSRDSRTSSAWNGIRYTLCGRLATRDVSDVFTPDQASCRECKARYRLWLAAQQAQQAQQQELTTEALRLLAELRRHGTPMSVRDLARATGIRYRAAWASLGGLRKRGLVTAEPRGMYAAAPDIQAPDTQA
jgi:predicted Rossmann fold nucleotide-binding protein DprA/Smf involved in DNA uptake